jgi:carbon monoxide dehydrogenase subunit G
MKLEQSFQVDAPIDQVWEALNDLERVAPCLPGATITDHDEDGTYHGTFQVKLGPTTAAYRGTIKIENADEEAREATLKARGTDKRGQGGASATIFNKLVEVDGGTRVDATTDFTITGRLARFGRGGMIEDISNRMLRDFSECLQTRLAEGGAAPAASAPDVAPDAAPAADAATVADAEGSEASRPAPSSGEADTAVKEPSSAAPLPRAATTPPAPGVPVKGFSLLFSVLWERLKRLFSRLFKRRG